MPHMSMGIKKVITHKPKKNKSNSDYIIKFILINPLKQDLTWIYFDKIISGSVGIEKKIKKSKKENKKGKKEERKRIGG
jgi:hypothetical protein